MKKRIISVLLLVCVLVPALSGCAAKLYDYETYADLIRLADTVGVEIFLSDINNGITDAYRGSVDEDDVKENEYTAANEDILIEHGDVTEIDYVGTIDGEEFTGGSATGATLEIGSNSYIDGFEDGLIGYTVGDKVTLNLRFPDDYQNNTSLRGKDVVFEVTIKSITRNTYPEYNDENVKKYTDYETVSEFETETRKEVIRSLVWQEYFTQCKIIKYPEKELRQYYDGTIDSATQNAAIFGMTLEGFVTTYYGYSDLTSYFEYVADAAQQSVKQDLIILGIVESNPSLQLSEADYEAKVEELYNESVSAGNYTGTLKQFKKDYDRDTLELNIYYDIVIDFLVSGQVTSDDVTKNGFVKDRNGLRYYIDDEMLTGWHELEIDGQTGLYYFDDETGYVPEKCALVTPQGESEPKYLEFDEYGRYIGLYDGRYDNASGTRFFEEGVLVTGWQEFDLDEDGTNETYYLDLENGYMKKGIQLVEGKYHDFGEDGVHIGIVTDGLHADDTGTRYFEDGDLITGWINLDVNEDGETERYYFNPDNYGYMCVDETTKIGDTYYTFGEDGALIGLADGLVTDDLGIRYFKEGVLQLGEQVIATDGTDYSYYFASPDGYALRSEWLTEPDGEGNDVNKYYYDEDGHKVVNQTLTIDSVKYQFDENGNYTIVED